MNRRTFIAATWITTAAGTRALSAESAQTGSLVKRNAVVLFQGDSITDAGRGRPDAAEANQQKALGNGYAWLAASQLLVDRPGDNLKFYNRGVSGHKVPQLAARSQKDCLDLKRDVLSILIGVNDIWHRINGKFDGTPASYERDCLALMDQTLKALPDVKLMICEPFLLRCGAVKDSWLPDFDAYRAASRKVAETFKATFVPFQTMFDEVPKLEPPDHWASDGVHPSASGASLMAHTWLKTVG